MVYCQHGRDHVKETLEQYGNPNISIKDIANADSYDLDASSNFLDIGSGLGKPNYHAAFKIGCYSMGIECSAPRVQGANFAKVTITKLDIPNTKWVDLVHFELGSAGKYNKFDRESSSDGHREDCSHIYSFNARMKN